MSAFHPHREGSYENTTPGQRFYCLSVNVRLSCLALVTEAFGGSGGIAQFNRDFLRALDKTQPLNEVLIVPRLGRGNVPNGYDSLRQDSAQFNRFAYALRAVARSLTIRPKLLVSGHLYHGPLARQIAFLTGARLISILHGTEIWRDVRPAHLAAVLASDLVICVSEDTRERYFRLTGDSNRGKVVVLHNTVEDRFEPGNRAAARARFDLDALPMILTVGRLDSRGGYKGHDRIIPMIARLRAIGRPTRYLIAGEGPDRERLETLVAEQRVADLVRFLGYVKDDDLPDLYRSADLFALPSTGEGFGIVYLEAMACGTPSLGLDVGGAKEALGSYGRAVPEAEFDAALIAMLDSPVCDPWELSRSVKGQFGRPAFEKQVASVMEEVIKA